MLHRSFYIQGKSATIRFPVLPHFVSEKPLQFVFRIIVSGEHAAIYDCRWIHHLLLSLSRVKF